MVTGGAARWGPTGQVSVGGKAFRLDPPAAAGAANPSLPGYFERLIHSMNPTFRFGAGT